MYIRLRTHSLSRSDLRASRACLRLAVDSIRYTLKITSVSSEVKGNVTTCSGIIISLSHMTTTTTGQAKVLANTLSPVYLSLNLCKSMQLQDRLYMYHEYRTDRQTCCKEGESLWKGKMEDEG